MHMIHVRARRGAGVEDCRSDRCGEPTAATYAKKEKQDVRAGDGTGESEAAEALAVRWSEDFAAGTGMWSTAWMWTIGKRGRPGCSVKRAASGHRRILHGRSGGEAHHGRFRRVGSLRHGPCDLRQPTKAKMKLLGVPAAMLENTGRVEPVARAMAEGVREVSGSELGIGITGVAGPTGDAEKPVGSSILRSVTARGRGSAG